MNSDDLNYGTLLDIILASIKHTKIKNMYRLGRASAGIIINVDFMEPQGLHVCGLVGVGMHDK